MEHNLTPFENKLVDKLVEFQNEKLELFIDELALHDYSSEGFTTETQVTLGPYPTTYPSLTILTTLYFKGEGDSEKRVVGKSATKYSEVYGSGMIKLITECYKVPFDRMRSHEQLVSREEIRKEVQAESKGS